jgi:hypothetical protein
VRCTWRARGYEKMHNILVEKPEVKRPFGRHRHRWKEYTDIPKMFFTTHHVGHCSQVIIASNVILILL